MLAGDTVADDDDDDVDDVEEEEEEEDGGDDDVGTRTGRTVGRPLILEERRAVSTISSP